MNGAAASPVKDVYRERNRQRFTADAPRIGIPLLFIAQWDDELAPRDAAFHLFGLLGSEKKTMHVNPGLHAAVPPAEFDASEQFFQHWLGNTPLGA